MTIVCGSFQLYFVLASRFMSLQYVLYSRFVSQVFISFCRISRPGFSWLLIGSFHLRTALFYKSSDLVLHLALEEPISARPLSTFETCKNILLTRHNQIDVVYNINAFKFIRSQFVQSSFQILPNVLWTNWRLWTPGRRFLRNRNLKIERPASWFRRTCLLKDNGRLPSISQSFSKS